MPNLLLIFDLNRTLFRRYFLKRVINEMDKINKVFGTTGDV